MYEKDDVVALLDFESQWKEFRKSHPSIIDKLFSGM